LPQLENRYNADGPSTTGATLKRRTLDRYLSHCGVASRERAKDLIASGVVRVNDLPATRPDRWIEPGRDIVTVGGQRIVAPTRRHVAVYNKPRGVLVTAIDPDRRTTIYDELPDGLRSLGLQAIGRLDRASAGLLLLTDDNTLSSRLLDKTFAVEKEYRVKVSPAPNTDGWARLRAGVDIGDATPTAPAVVELERENPKSAVIRITLIEGRNRQIRRMVAAIGSEVEWLVRVRFGPIELGNLDAGEGRLLTPSEFDALRASVNER